MTDSKMFHLFLEACSRNDLRTVRLSLRDPRRRRDLLDIVRVGQQQQCPLGVAASRGHEDVVQLLLRDPGMDVNQKDGSGNTALHLATSSGHWGVVNQILDHPECLPDAANKSGQTALTMGKEKLHRSDLNPIANGKVMRSVQLLERRAGGASSSFKSRNRVTCPQQQQQLVPPSAVNEKLLTRKNPSFRHEERRSRQSERNRESRHGGHHSMIPRRVSPPPGIREWERGSGGGSKMLSVPARRKKRNHRPHLSLKDRLEFKTDLRQKLPAANRMEESTWWRSRRPIQDLRDKITRKKSSAVGDNNEHRPETVRASSFKGPSARDSFKERNDEFPMSDSGDDEPRLTIHIPSTESF